jgi:hypothetical protein
VETGARAEGATASCAEIGERAETEKLGMESKNMRMPSGPVFNRIKNFKWKNDGSTSRQSNLVKQVVVQTVQRLLV